MHFLHRRTCRLRCGGRYCAEDMTMTIRQVLRWTGRAVLESVICVVVTSSLMAQGQPDAFVTGSEKSYQAAFEFQKRAESSKSSQESAVNFSNAVAQCDLALKLRPDFYRAQALAAHCYYRWARLSGASSQHRDLVQAAKERFALAARCTGVQSALFREWGAMLMAESSLEAAAGARQAELRQAKTVLESGLESATYTGERARLQQDIGICLLLLARNTEDEPGKRAWYEAADRQFDAASKVESVANLPELDARWGAGLVDYGKLTNDRELLRKAVEKLGTAMEKDEQNQEVQYNLACAYALLDQPDQALRHLRICLENDNAQHIYLNAVAKDPDFASLRDTAEYKEMFPDDHGTSTVIDLKARISDQ